jgi:hypothetical protein
MADTKISALTASTTPLAGTEVLPIVQSGTTKQVSVANLTAGRAISATQLTLTTGSVIVADGQGIDFSATPGTGTSELLNDYEEGTWTPVLRFGGDTTGITYTTQTGTYTKIGRVVCARATILLSSNGSASGGASVAGLPFTVAVTTAASIYQDGISYGGSLNVGAEGTVDRFAIQQVSEAGANSNLDRTSFSNTAFFTLAVCYQV